MMAIEGGDEMEKNKYSKGKELRLKMSAICKALGDSTIHKLPDLNLTSL